MHGCAGRIAPKCTEANAVGAHVNLPTDLQMPLQAICIVQYRKDTVFSVAYISNFVHGTKCLILPEEDNIVVLASKTSSTTGVGKFMPTTSANTIDWCKAHFNRIYANANGSRYYVFLFTNNTLHYFTTHGDIATLLLNNHGSPESVQAAQLWQQLELAMHVTRGTVKVGTPATRSFARSCLGVPYFDAVKRSTPQLPTEVATVFDLLSEDD